MHLDTIYGTRETAAVVLDDISRTEPKALPMPDYTRCVWAHERCPTVRTTRIGSRHILRKKCPKHRRAGTDGEM